MKRRQLGLNGLQVSAIGPGCMGLSFGLGPAADKRYGTRMTRDAFERGACARIASICSTHIASIPTCRSRTWRAP